MHKKSNKGHNSVKFHRSLRKVNQVNYNMYQNSMSDIIILAQWFSRYCVDKIALLYKTPNSEREIIQANINRILSKDNQVIYTLDTICEPDIMILAQAVLHIHVFCCQRSIGLQCKSRKRGQRRGITLQLQVRRKRNIGPLNLHAYSTY